MRQASTRRHVALLIETSNAYARGLLRGIHAYSREHGGWSLYLGEQRRGEAAPRRLAGAQVDGIIARIENAAIARTVRASGVPAIDVSAARILPDLPFVETDDAAIARLAAEHLLQRGFRHFGFCGDARFNWSQAREEGFHRLVVSVGGDCSLYRAPKSARRPLPWERERQALVAWLRRLPRPVGIMAAYDIRGRVILDVCREMGIKVPDEAAVLGVDNDELLCDLADPPLSSIIPDTRRTGYEAARLLDQMMAGKKVAHRAHLIPPLGVATRRSTDVLAIDDSDISTALRFIRSHAAEGINVDDVLKVVSMSRRVLEVRFQKLLGRTPHEEITRARLERVKELLTETDLSLTAIAHRTGYKHVEYLSVVFKRETGQSPGEYRTQHRKQR